MNLIRFRCHRIEFVYLHRILTSASDYYRNHGYVASQFKLFWKWLLFYIIIIFHKRVWSQSCCVGENQTSPFYISGFESWIGIHAFVTCHGRAGLAGPIPLQVRPEPMSSNLKSRLGHGHMPVDPVGGILVLDSSLSGILACFYLEFDSFQEHPIPKR